MTTSVDDVLPRLDGVRRTRRGWSARCPAHCDRSPSLSVAVGDNGRALLYCHAGCQYDEIITALGVDSAVATTTRIIGPQSPRALALAIARRQPWFDEQTRSAYRISDAIRARRRAVSIARDAATRAGDREDAWELLATAAVVETEAAAIEAALDEASA